jgi:acetate kinase
MRIVPVVRLEAPALFWMKVLVINCGGSSIKYQVIDTQDESVLCKGSVENIGSDEACLKHTGVGGSKVDMLCTAKTHSQGLKVALGVITDPSGGGFGSIDAVGHRLVHGGEEITGAVRINQKIMEVLEKYSELAPLHNPPNIMGIRACMELLPEIPQVGVFDTAFHTSLPAYSYTYAIPYEYYEKYGVRRYGFHGIAFTYMTNRASQIVDRPLSDMKVVSLMLGSGTTANALCHGRSVDVSTGLTPCEGLIQSTRCGDIDPAAITYLMRRESLTPEEMDHIMNKESGWLGISGISNNLRMVYEEASKGNKRAQVAIESTAYRARKYVGAYSAAMGGIDMLVFSGGVGQNSPEFRKLICSGLEFLGIELAESQNASVLREGIISTGASRVAVVVVEMDEEIVIARETKRVVLGRSE